MKIRFFHIKLITMAEGEQVIPDGELWTEDGVVSYAGSADGAPNPEGVKWDRQIDGRGNLVIPGFKNAHTHSAMTFLRSFADDLPLAEWLNRQVFPMEAKLTPEDVYHLSKLALMEYLTSGITANFDMYMYPDQIALASADCGFRTVIAGTLNDFSSSLEEEDDHYVRLNCFHPLIRYQLGFHAEYTTGESLLKGLSGLAEKHRAPVYCHNSETAAEVAGCVERHKATPTVYLNSLGLFQYGGGGFHCLYMSPEDLEIFQRKRLYAVTNPASNLKLASGIAPVGEMVRLGIPVAIGTDGPASNNCLDMFREMFLVTGLAKGKEQDAAAMPAGEVLRMACCEGARAMGLSDCDSLAAGKRADLVMIDLNQPNMQPENHVMKNLVYSGSKQNVKLTMIDGRILYENGEFRIGEDPARIYRKANEIMKRCREGLS